MSTTWTECDRECDPQAHGARTDGATHYIDCPVWDYLEVDPYVAWRESQ